MPKDAIVNIGPAERRQRAVFGLVALAIAVGFALAPHQLGLAPGVRFASLPFVYGAFLGLLQAKDKT